MRAANGLLLVLVGILLLSFCGYADDDSPSAVMDRYFAAVQTHDVNNVLALFAEDAVIATSKSSIQGHGAIAEFYLGGVLKCQEFKPEHGPYFLAGQQMIAVEIVLNCDGVKKPVGDFFTIVDGKIKEMRIYSGKGYLPN